MTSAASTGLASCAVMKKALIVSIILAWRCAVAADALAQEDFEHGRGDQPGNYLGGHRFSPSFLIPNPFANTQVSVGFGAGHSSPTVSALGIERELDIGIFAPFLEAQFTIFPKFTLAVAGWGMGLSGITSDSVIIYGATAIYRAGIGALYQFWTGDRAAVSFGLNVVRPRLFAVSPLAGVREGIQGVFNGSGADASNSNEVWSYVPNLRYAYAFSPVVGLQGQVGLVMSTANDDESIESGSGFVFSIGPDIQLKPWFGVPLSVTATYKGNEQIGRDTKLWVNSWGAAVYLTEAKSFNVGAEFIATVNPSATVDMIGIVTRYYF